MPIANPNPETVPALTFDRLYATTIIISAIRDKDQRIVDASADVVLVPYSSETGIDLSTSQKQLSIKSIEQKVVENPDGKLALAYAAMIDAISEEYLLSIGGGK